METMEYRGYTITAEVQTYEEWAIDEQGQPTEWIRGFDGLDVVGYHIEPVGDPTKADWTTMTNIESVKGWIDTIIEKENQ